MATFPPRISPTATANQVVRIVRIVRIVGAASSATYPACEDNVSVSSCSKQNVGSSPQRNSLRQRDLKRLANP
jgi:hypothetical protein